MKSLLSSFFSSLAVLLTFATPGSFAHAQTHTLVSDSLGLRGDNLGGYFNNLFELALLVGAVLAVLIIASAGLQYMSTDAVSGKTTSRERIVQAVLGLLMLLAVWLFFKEINPQILQIDFALDKAATTGAGLDTNSLSREQVRQADIARRAARNPILPGSTIGTSLINPKWTLVPPNKTCVDAKGGGWTKIDAHHCAGDSPGSGYDCCGQDPNYKPPPDPAPADTRWCIWGTSGAPDCKDESSVSGGYWCYDLEEGGANCYTSENLCDTNSAINGSSSCTQKGYEVGNRVTIDLPGDPSIDLPDDPRHGQTGTIVQVIKLSNGDLRYIIEFSDGQRINAGSRTFNPTQ